MNEREKVMRPLRDFVNQHGVYATLTFLAEIVREGGKKHKSEVQRLTEEIARNIERARDAT